MERKREEVDGTLSQDWLQRRLSAGWRPVAVEWERGKQASDEPLVEVPFGLEAAPDGAFLRRNSEEMAIIESILDLIGQDCPLSEVAASLNGNGQLRRDGESWTPSNLFGLLPRVIEVAPEIYRSSSWSRRRSLREV